MRLSALLLLLMAAPALAEPPRPIRSGDVLEGTITDVYSGDELVLRQAQKHFRQVVLSDLDAVEREQAHGRTARRFLRELLQGKPVKAYVQRVDKYHVPHVRLYAGETDVNFELLANGHAWVRAGGETPPEYVKAEQFAREKRLGLWAKPDPEEPWDYRKRTHTGRKLMD